METFLIRALQLMMSLSLLVIIHEGATIGTVQKRQ